MRFNLKYVCIASFFLCIVSKKILDFEHQVAYIALVPVLSVPSVGGAFPKPSITTDNLRH